MLSRVIARTASRRLGAVLSSPQVQLMTTRAATWAKNTAFSAPPRAAPVVDARDDRDAASTRRSQTDQSLQPLLLHEKQSRHVAVVVVAHIPSREQPLPPDSQRVLVTQAVAAASQASSRHFCPGPSMPTKHSSRTSLAAQRAAARTATMAGWRIGFSCNERPRAEKKSPRGPNLTRSSDPSLFVVRRIRWHLRESHSACGLQAAMAVVGVSDVKIPKLFERCRTQIDFGCLNAVVAQAERGGVKVGGPGEARSTRRLERPQVLLNENSKRLNVRRRRRRRRRKSRGS